MENEKDMLKDKIYPHLEDDVWEKCGVNDDVSKNLQTFF